jgi:CRISPR-associated protein Cmr5
VSQPTLAQRRAAHALARVQAHEKTGPKSYGKYVSYAEALPATILMNGLGQAAATLLSKAAGDARAHRLLFDDLQSWLCGSDTAAPYPGEKDLMKAIVARDPHDYLRAQAEALEFLVWLKKFANAFLKREEKR